MKKIISVLIVIAMLVCVCCTGMTSAYAATTGNCGAGTTSAGSNAKFSYNTSTKTLSITGTGATKNYGDTALNRQGWYEYRDQIRTIVVGEGITTLGTLFFSYCTAVTSVTLPSTLTKIGGGTANYGAFKNCTSLASITLPEGLQEIDDMAFRGCTALTSITFPNSLTTIGAEAFIECSSLETVTFGTGMTGTGTGTFRETGVRTVNFSSSITSIDPYCFYNTRLTEISIPDTVTSIGLRSFANSTHLASATVFNSSAEFQGIVGEDPFNSCSSSLVMRGHTGSTTQTYAAEKGYRFLTIDSCSHETTRTETVDPTCTETGTTRVICESCGLVISEETIPANGHTYELAETNDNTEVDGHIYSLYRCSVCNEEETRIQHVKDVEGYYEYNERYAATCTRPGAATLTCTVEGCNHVTPKILPAGHTIDEYTVTKEATCTEAGEKTGTCSACGETVTETIPATGHTYEITDTIDSTEDDGHIYEISECTVCHERSVKVTHVEWMEGFYESSVVTEPKCVVNGVGRDDCTVENCGKTRLTTIPATGEHDWYVLTETEPTCTARGAINYACHNCNMTKVEYVEPLGHDYEIIAERSYAPTCTATGLNVYKCNRCSMQKEESVAATGHTELEGSYRVVTAPTCTAEGLAKATCSVCNEDYDITLDALGHDFVDEESQIADKPGHVNATPVCQRCGYRDSTSVKHKEWIEEYTDTRVITKGTCTVAEITRDTCTLCGETRNNTTPAPGHVYSYTSMGDDGTLTYTCSVCNNEQSMNPTYVAGIFQQYINQNPADSRLGYMFELIPDGIINAKDFAEINMARVLKVNSTTTTTTEEETSADEPGETGSEQSGEGGE